MSVGEQDRDWFCQYVNPPSEDALEWFLERVAIRCESGMNVLQARNATYSDYLQHSHERQSLS